jgi:hypothetical protein
MVGQHAVIALRLSPLAARSHLVPLTRHVCAAAFRPPGRLYRAKLFRFGEMRRLVGCELKARGLDSFTAAQP